MPWRLRKEIILILAGAAAIAISITVWILGQNLSSDLLAIVGFVGGIAIIVRTLPSNGKTDSS